MIENGDWRSKPLTRALLREHVGGSLKRHRFALSIALATAIIVWGLCYEIAQTGNPALPAGAESINVSSDYPVPYDVYRLGATLTLVRVRDNGPGFIVAMATFGIVWWLIFLGQEFKSDRRNRSFSAGSFLFFNGLFGAYLAWMIYAFVAPSLGVLIHPQALVFDPSQDLVTLNDSALFRMSDIAEFEGVEKQAYHSDWSWLGVKFKDGNYYAFVEGEFVGGNVEILAPYLNRYLKQNPPVQEP